MKIWNGVGDYPRSCAPAVATIGNYDGVHVGHREILRHVVTGARNLDAPALLIGFSPHPVEIVAPEKKPRLLQTRGQRLESLQETGLTDVLIVEFDAQLAALDGERFFDEVLGDRVPLAALYVGDGFRFGRDRAGDVELLRRIGSHRGFEVHGLEPCKLDGETVSSTAIRRALRGGDLDKANRMLGRPYVVSGEVVHGDGRGRELGCPTANLDVVNEILPAAGVYVTETLVLAARFPSVTNVGVRPTFGGEEKIHVETHLLEFDEELYHERADLRFLARLRDEQRFDGPSALADQLARDRAAAEAFFQNQPLGRE